MKTFLVITQLMILQSILTSPSFAAPGISAVVNQMQNPNNDKGLCLAKNRLDIATMNRDPNNAEGYINKGYCAAIWEALTNEKHCVAQKLEEVRQKVLGRYKPKNQNDKDYVDTVFRCSSKDGKSIEDMAKNKELFANIVMQFMITLANETSGLVANANKNSGGRRGIINLNADMMDDPKYACACQQMVGVGQARSNPKFIENWPTDGPHSLVCATYMALTAASQDGTLFAGSAKVDPETGKNSLEGAAKIWPDVLSQVDDESVPDSKKTTLRISKKLENYCEKGIGSVNRWEPPTNDIGLDGTSTK